MAECRWAYRGRIEHLLVARVNSRAQSTTFRQSPKSSNIKLVPCLTAACFSSGGWVGRHPSWEGGLEIVWDTNGQPKLRAPPLFIQRWRDPNGIVQGGFMEGSPLVYVRVTGSKSPSLKTWWIELFLNATERRYTASLLVGSRNAFSLRAPRA